MWLSDEDTSVQTERLWIWIQVQALFNLKFSPPLFSPQGGGLS